jgi:hypothetical protein
VYTIRNNNTAPRMLLIEHPRRAGWALAAGLEPAETSTASYRFKVPVAARQTTTFTVEEQQPTRSEYQVSSLTADRVSVLVRDAGGKGPDLSAALAPILDNKTAVMAMVTQNTDLDRQIKQISEDEQRVRENMRVLKDTPEERRLARRYAAQLEASEMRIDALRKEQSELNGRLKEAVTAGMKLFQDLAMELTLAP